MNEYFEIKQKLITTEELAERTGLTVRFWENRRLLGNTPPFIRLGCRAVRYRWEDVEKWLAERVCTGTSDQGKTK